MSYRPCAGGPPVPKLLRRARPPLDVERLEPGWVEAGYAPNAAHMCYDPVWRNARLDATLTFCGSHWTCTRGRRRAAEDTALYAMVEALY